MPKTRIQQANPNLEKLSSGNKKKAISDVIDNIKAVADVMRDKNNIILGANYRLDSKPMSAAGNGFKAGDYKVDIQTVTKQKKLSKTVAIAYVSPLASTLSDLIDALNESLDNQDIYRVT